jgi:flagellar biosynthesis/type III secretory pathway protein FliH
MTNAQLKEGGRMKRGSLIAILGTIFLGSFVLPHDVRGAVSKDQAFRLGYDEGYKDGARQGQNDYRAGRGYGNRSERYGKADDGWRNSIGHRGDYRKGYQQGYDAGYRSANQGYGRGDSGRYPDRYPDSRYPDSRYPDSRYPDSRYPYPQNTRYNHAFDMGVERGYRDGQEKGLEDYRKNRNPDVSRHGDYRDADDGYKSSYGDKRDYESGYRRGFEQGYRDAFNGGRGYRKRAGRTF